MANIINVIVKDAETPEDDIIVPDTGWYTSSIERHDTEANFVAPFIGIGVISFALLLILMFAKRKWKRISHFGALSILAILGTGVSIYGVIANSRVSATDNLISITSSDTTITVVREEGAEATYGVATATIELNEITALGYNIFAYTPDGNVLHVDTGDGVINPVDTNNSALSNNTWGIALTDQTDVKAEDSVWNIIDDESNPLLVASFDESTTAGTTVTLRYGVLVDSSLPVGVYSANIEYKAYQRAYTITFDPGEGQITTPTKPVIIGEQIGELPVPIRTNYNFLGWFTEDDQQINETTVPDGNTTYHAKWDRITYNITFDPGEGTITSGDASKTVQAGETLGTLPEATRENYTFTGWWTAAEGGTRVTTATEPTESTTYFAHWSRDTYTITFNAGEGTIAPQDAERSIDAGEAIGTLPDATRTNYTLDGWYTEETEGTKITAETTPTGTTTYYAHWNRIEYTITYNLMGGNISGDTTNPTATVQAGETLSNLPQTPSKTNYTFAGWYTAETGGDPVTTETRPDGTTTYFAHWNRIEYEITFDLWGGNIAGDTTNPTATVQAGETLGSLPQDPSKENHTFAGWWTEETNGTEVTTETVPESTTTYYAHWTEALTPCNPNATTIGTGNNTDAVCMQDVASMSKTTLASAINNMTAETNYTLRDSRDDQDYTIAKLKDGKIWMTKNMNLPGETKLYSDDSDVPSGYNKGEGASDNPYFTLPTSSTTGFDDDTKAFVYNADNQTNTCTEPGCYSYYSWLAATAGGKDASGNAVADYHNAPYSICPAGWGLPTATTSNAPAQTSPNWKTGDFYKLATAYGANLEDNSYDNSSATGGNFVTNAGPTSALPKFLLGGIYGSSAFRNGGSRGYYWSATSTFSSTAYNLDFYSSAVISAGYNTRGCGFSVRCMLRMPTNTITFNANGGTIDGDNTITHKVDVGSTLGTLPEPTRTGYDFTGWFTEETEGTQITAETKPDGDTTYYAHWTLSNPVVTFNTDGGSNVPAQTLTPGEKAIRPTTNPTKSGYNFVDWYTNDSYSTLFDFDTPINTNTTIYARFVENRYIAEMNGDVYETIQSAVDIAPSNQTTIRLLADTSEKVTIESGQDIILNLNSETLSYPGSGENVIINKGNLTLENGTVSSTGGKGMINNNAGATLTTRNVSLAVTTTTPKQVIYNNGGTAYISEGTNIETMSSSAGAIDNHGGTMVIENARIVSTGARQGVYNDNNGSLEIRGANTYISAKPDVGSTNRAAVQSVNGSLVITGGTIVSKDYAVTVQDGSFRLGTQDDAYNDENPEIRGGKYGIQSSVNYSVYDGIIEGKTAAVNDETKITGKETNYGLVNDTKDIDGTTYQTIYYETETEYTITFNLNGGNINGSTTNPTATVQIGDTLGTLPADPTRTNYTFDGWYTELNGGTKITANTRPTESRSYFAHWNKIEYTITFDLKGGNINGSTTNPTATVYAGEALGTFPTEPTRTNYTFDGWFTTETGGDEVTTGTIPTGTTTYFAHWTLVAVTFDDAYTDAGMSKDTTSNKYKMHEMTAAICEAVTTGQTGELVDARDGTVYNVGKLADGRCWMQDNLALDPTLASVQANMTPSTTNATQAAIDNFKNGSDTAPQTGWSTGAVSYETSSSVWNQPRINTASKDLTRSDLTNPSDSLTDANSWKFGVYYNYCAASIGTYCHASGSGMDMDSASAIDVKNDICPAGWRMPTGGAISSTGTTAGGGEYQVLYNAYPAISGGDNQYTRFRKVFHLPLSGYFYYGSPNDQGSNANVWSSTYSISSHMYNLNADTSGIYPQNRSNRYCGFPVRCVADNVHKSLITFNANGGVVEGGSATTRRITEGQALGTLPETTREGYAFDGWYTEAEGGTVITNQTVPTGTTTYYAHWDKIVSFDEAYVAAGKSRDATSGKYKIQDMNKNICDAVSMSKRTAYAYTNTQETQLVDIRDGKTYWVAKLKDGHCWMTQNLDLDLETTPDHVLALTSENTDLNEFGSNNYDASNGYSKNANDVITWTPERNTIPTSNISSTGSITGWANDYENPYSVDTGDWYWIGEWYNTDCDSNPWCNYLSGAGNENGKFSNNPHVNNGNHGHVGNYYNWSAAIASNNSSNYSTSTYEDITRNPQNSICPASWRLPTVSDASDVAGSTNEFKRLVTLYSATTTDRYNIASPLYFVRGGFMGGSLDYGSLYDSGKSGYYWSSTVRDSNNAYNMNFYYSKVNPVHSAGYRNIGYSVRCVARDIVPTNAITFDANGGLVENESTIVRDVERGSALGTLPEAIRDGYIFEGWYTEISDGIEVTTQTVPSGAITYYARWSVAPTTFNNAFSAAGKTKDTTTKKYKMQDMNTSICEAVTTPTAADYSDTQEVQLVDIRDGKVYWVAKLLDGKCWMTQNLDLDLVHAENDDDALYTHENTDLGWGSDKTTVKWNPARRTIPSFTISSAGSFSDWNNSFTSPYSVDVGAWYWIGNWNNNGTYTWYNSEVNNYLAGNIGNPTRFMRGTFSGNGTHGQVGNYYNWPAAIASNDSSSYTLSTIVDITNNPQNSICPAGWRLPTAYGGDTAISPINEFKELTALYGNTTSDDKALTASPLWFVRGGHASSGSLRDPGYSGSYWSSTVENASYSYSFTFFSSKVYSATATYKNYGKSIRCVVR